MEDGIQNRSLFWFKAALKSGIRHPPSAILWIAGAMLCIGLVMSYSRGAWLATTVGFLYLAWSYGKLKWRLILPMAAIAAAVILYLWGSTPDSAPWYVKRADLGRPSAQNRVTAWRAGIQMMLDHPLGVGWNQAVSMYDKQYSPPEGGAAALTMNSYLMLGTELGLPGLFCFVTYVGLCFRGKGRMQHEEGRIRAACRAGALVFVVAFWFDGGLFDLPTAAMFWVLLELGATQLLTEPARPAADKSGE
jgi:O-antigen ligase